MKKNFFLLIIFLCISLSGKAQKVVNFIPIEDYDHYEGYTYYEAEDHATMYIVNFEVRAAMNVTLSNCGSVGMTHVGMILNGNSGEISLATTPCGTNPGISEATVFLSPGHYTWKVTVTAQQLGWRLNLTISSESEPYPQGKPVDLGTFFLDCPEYILDESTSDYLPFEGNGGAVIYYFKLKSDALLTFNIHDGDSRVILHRKTGGEVFRTEGKTGMAELRGGEYVMYVDFVSGKDDLLDFAFSVDFTNPYIEPRDTLLDFPAVTKSALPLIKGNKNYVFTRVWLDEQEKSHQDFVQYYDGLGYPSLTLEKGMAPAGKSLVSLVEYDNMGRESKYWLPVDVNGGTYHLAPAEMSARAYERYQDNRAYTQTRYEDSPLDRTVAQVGPGEAWEDHPQQTAYLTNGSAGEWRCSQYVLNTAGQPVRQGDYEPGELYVTKTQDEDGHTQLTFNDKEGRTVLSRQMAGSAMYDTYYIYDRMGNLCHVLPPMIQDNLTSANLNLYAYSYTYDNMNRCVEKKLPGTNNRWRYVYDKADRLVYQQDGVQAGRNEWTFFLYDALGREVVKGLCTSATRPSADGVVVKASRSDGNGLNNTGYEVENFPFAPRAILAVKYYDDYSYLDMVPHTALKSNLKYGFSDVSGSSSYGKQYVKYGIPDISERGLLTGLKSYTADGSSSYLTAYYYDVDGNIIQRRGSHPLGGYDKDFFLYSFSGKLLQHLHVHSASGKPTQTETYTYVYDSQQGDNPERLQKVQHKLGSGNTVTLASYTYDELGRLETKTPHGMTAQKQTYSYNLRGWLTNVGMGKYYQTLYYNTGSGTPCYNGNISSMTWGEQNMLIPGGLRQIKGYNQYIYQYDPLNRLVSAEYDFVNPPLHTVNSYSECVTGYDKNGNILGLQRYGDENGIIGGLINELSFAYSGNQLTGMTEAGQSELTFAYDANGNLTKDLTKNITGIQYNFLNLPSKVTFGDGSTITYTYAADGTKLRTVHKSGSTTTTMDYCGNVIYENGVQKLLLTEEGYVTLSDKKYHYYLKDHQGNNRVVVSQTGVVEETNHYYPFGGLFANADGVQPYKYNGKELDTTKDLNLYDYGARMYDPTLGRFTTMDRFAEKYYHLSPYAYAGNNPVRNIDVNGDSIIIAPNPNGIVDQIKMFFGMDTKYQSQVKNDLTQLKKDDKSIGDMITTLERSSNIHKITMPNKYSKYQNATRYDAEKARKREFQGSIVHYDPFNKGIKTRNIRAPRVGLAHELQHSWDLDQGIFDPDTKINGILMMDIRAVNTENRIRKITGDPKRTQYGKKKIHFELLD